MQHVTSRASAQTSPPHVSVSRLPVAYFPFRADRNLPTVKAAVAHRHVDEVGLRDHLIVQFDDVEVRVR